MLAGGNFREDDGVVRGGIAGLFGATLPPGQDPLTISATVDATGVSRRRADNSGWPTSSVA